MAGAVAFLVLRWALRRILKRAMKAGVRKTARRLAYTTLAFQNGVPMMRRALLGRKMRR